MGGAAAVVALDHGVALGRLGVSRVGFACDVLALFRPLAGSALSRPAAVVTV